MWWCIGVEGYVKAFVGFGGHGVNPIDSIIFYITKPILANEGSPRGDLSLALLMPHVKL
jgi:hypothetical protein